MERAGSQDPDGVWAGEGLTISVAGDPDLRSRVRVTGRLTSDSATLLRTCLYHQITAGRRHAGVDLSGITHVDEAGFSAVLEAHRAFRRCRGTLIVSAVSPPVRRLITLLQADGVLLIDARADLAPLDEPLPDGETPDGVPPAAAR